MVDVVPFDNISDTHCRWKIKGYGIVFGRVLEKELKEYYSEQELLEEERKRIGGEKKR